MTVRPSSHRRLQREKKTHCGHFRAEGNQVRSVVHDDDFDRGGQLLYVRCQQRRRSLGLAAGAGFIALDGLFNRIEPELPGTKIAGYFQTKFAHLGSKAYWSVPAGEISGLMAGHERFGQHMLAEDAFALRKACLLAESVNPGICPPP